MMEGNRRYKVYTSQQVRGVAGLVALGVSAAASAYELPDIYALVLLCGGSFTWFIAFICAFRCYNAKHDKARHEGPGKLCPVCHFAAGKDSYHCDFCGVCVAGFSHHSDWLNSCIGKANYPVYLGCLGSIGLAGGFQVAAYLGVLVAMVQDKATMIRLNEKYSMMDQGYFFHLVLYFALMVSFILAGTNCVNLTIRIWKIVSKRLEKPIIKPQQISPILYPPLRPVFSSEAPIYSMNIYNSFDSHTADISNGGVTALP